MFDCQSGGGKPPRDLTSLVEELVLSETEESLWGSQFRQFLHHRGQKDLEHALDFVTVTAKLSTAQDQAKSVSLYFCIMSWFHQHSIHSSNGY